MGARMLAVGIVLGLLGAACGADAAPARYQPRIYGDHPTPMQLSELGRAMFMDRTLSASGQLACSSCHDPQHHFAPPDAAAVQRGGASLTQQGSRHAPSLQYLETSLPFTEHHIDDEDGHGADAGPSGGLAWDGRADTPHEQALMPLFAANEMANASVERLRDAVRRSAYAREFRRAFSGPAHDVFADPTEVTRWVGEALEVYQQDAPSFYPFSSKYDAFLRGQIQLDAREARGLAVFNDPGKGNCASCHPSARRGGALPVFTDGGYGALGVPRNRALAVNLDPRYHDLGLCGPLREDLRDRAEYCAMFKVPSLRNVATRGAFFHNGVFRRLRDVLEFYALRDIQPQRWYGRDARGQVQRYDDVPPVYAGNVDRLPPFSPLANGQPRMNETDIDDVQAFLQTLTDGFVPPPAVAPSAQRPRGGRQLGHR